MKKILAVGLAAMFALSACSNGEKQATEATPATAAGSSPGVSESAKPAKLSLNWSVAGGNLANVTLPSADKDFVKKAIEEKFNVDLNIDYMLIRKRIS